MKGYLWNVKVDPKKKPIYLQITILLLFIFVVFVSIKCGGSGGSGSSSTSTCPSGNFSCGNPAGGPTCCPVGDSCCFGFNLCCDENHPHLGQKSDGTKACFQSLQGEGVTWTLLTVCGKPV
jgi:hypothetical protein